MKQKAIVGMDRGFHFKPDEIETELKEGRAKNIEDVWIFPPNAGKIMQPLGQHSLALDEGTSSQISPEDEDATATELETTFMGTIAKEPSQLLSNLCAYPWHPYKDLNV